MELFSLFLEEVQGSPILQLFIGTPILIAFVSAVLRWRLFSRLMEFIRWDWAVASETTQAPVLIQNLRQRMTRCLEKYDEINTVALVDYTLGQERLWGMSLEQIEYLTRVTPNLLIAIGLLGTFLGITINVFSIIDNLGTLDISALQGENPAQQNVVLQELFTRFREPLRGMALAFVSSLVSLSLGIFLTFINSIWNTTLARRHFFAAVELHLDHELASEQRNPTGRLIRSIDRNFSIFLENFHETVTRAIGEPLERELANLRQMHSKNIELAERVFARIDNAAGNLVSGANIFQTAVRTLENSEFAEKFSTATQQLAQFIDQLTEAGARSQELNSQVIALTSQVSETLERVNRTHVNFEEIASDLSTTTTTFRHIHDMVLGLVNQIEQVNRQVAQKSTELAQVADQLTELLAIAQRSQNTLSQNQQELLTMLRSMERLSNDVGQHLLQGNEELRQVRFGVSKFSTEVSNIIEQNKTNQDQLLTVLRKNTSHVEQLSTAANQISRVTEQLDRQYKSLTDQLTTLRNSFENYRKQRSASDGDRQSQIKALEKCLEQVTDQVTQVVNEQLSQLKKQSQDSGQSMTKAVQSLEQINRNLVTLSQKITPAPTQN
ncbi:methyl-accepting chemotaxis protein [Thermosynechococcus sp. FA-CM-4201]